MILASPTAVMVGLALSAALLSMVLTGLARRYALRRGIMDHPSHRSSHTQPTPRGGGLALAAVILGFVVVVGWAGWLDFRAAVALGVGGGMVALIGWLDDRRNVPFVARLLVHAAAAALAVALLGGLDRISLGSLQIDLGPAGYAVAWLGTVWLINLYNFMDGIDGLAGAEAVIVGSGAAVLLVATGAPALAAVCVVTAGAAAGFLVWNWAPAKIFLGDVGSGLLGYAFAVIGLAAHTSRAMEITVWVTLLAVFAVDATLTLARRVIRGQRAADAHRSHAYQRMVQWGWSHARVSLAVSVINALCFAAAAAMIANAAASPLIVTGVLLVLAVAYLFVESRVPMWKPRTGSSPIDSIP